MERWCVSTPVGGQELLTNARSKNKISRVPCERGMHWPSARGPGQMCCKYTRDFIRGQSRCCCCGRETGITRNDRLHQRSHRQALNRYVNTHAHSEKLTETRCVCVSMTTTVWTLWLGQSAPLTLRHINSAYRQQNSLKMLIESSSIPDMGFLTLLISVAPTSSGKTENMIHEHWW